MTGIAIQKKGLVQNFGHEWEESFLAPALVVDYEPPIMNTLKNLFVIITVINFKRTRVFSFKATNLHHVR